MHDRTLQIDYVGQGKLRGLFILARKIHADLVIAEQNCQHLVRVLHHFLNRWLHRCRFECR